ncbi:hypothetical protein DKK66_05400 [Aquitalea sp. USM4]|nr:hypothetical protein DKK66_05400 [Aquitalea sp. USM4]
MATEKNHTVVHARAGKALPAPGFAPSQCHLPRGCSCGAQFIKPKFHEALRIFMPHCNTDSAGITHPHKSPAPALRLC